jgi:hypothetical protein
LKEGVDLAVTQTFAFLEIILIMAEQVGVIEHDDNPIEKTRILSAQI